MYVGQSIKDTPDDRWYRHRLESSIGSRYYLHRSLRRKRSVHSSLFDFTIHLRTHGVSMAKESKLANMLASFAGVAEDTSAGGKGKTAAILTTDDHPSTNMELQLIVGDPDDTAISTFAQFRPNPHSEQIPNPLSPIQGDEVFFMYLYPGAVFQAHDGSQWFIEDYSYSGAVDITNRWYPRMNAIVSVYDVRRSIAAWIEPVQQTVPPMPLGVNYDAQPVAMMNPDPGVFK
jgi:hypothetical protein